MNKKKIAALLVAGVMTVGVVGGTLAWFTSWDSVTNVFNTGDITESDDPNNNGVQIYEEFTSPEYIVPGDTITKLVQIKNTTNYDSFIRVKINNPIWLNEKDDSDANLGEENLTLNFTNNVVEYAGKTTDGKDYYTLVKDNNTKVSEADLHGKWIKHGDYYYYVGRVPGEKFTNTLLESVTFSPKTTEINNNADNEYRNKKFNVEVIAESIQADNDAYKNLPLIKESDEGKKDNDQRILDLLAKYSDKNASGLDSGNDKVENANVTETTTTIRNYQKPEQQ